MSAGHTTNLRAFDVGAARRYLAEVRALVTEGLETSDTRVLLAALETLARQRATAGLISRAAQRRGAMSLTCDKSVSTAIEAVLELGRLARSSEDPAIARFAFAFFEAHGPIACKMVADVQRHPAPRLGELGQEPFNLTGAELERERSQR